MTRMKMQSQQKNNSKGKLVQFIGLVVTNKTVARHSRCTGSAEQVPISPPCPTAFPLQSKRTLRLHLLSSMD